VIYLLDSDHNSILQRHSGPEFATLKGQVAQQARTELAFSIISTQDQVLGCHA
jgi:tRNA(fMet)-specific endonuclease VapC